MFLDLLLNYYQVVYYCYQVYFLFLFCVFAHQALRYRDSVQETSASVMWRKAEN